MAFNPLLDQDRPRLAVLNLKRSTLDSAAPSPRKVDLFDQLQLRVLSSYRGKSHSQPLNRRMIMRYVMEPLEKEEIREYVVYHLEDTGASVPLFSEEALEAVSSLSHGWPRVINNLCVDCLLLGAQAKKELIDAETVRLAAQETGM